MNPGISLSISNVKPLRYKVKLARLFPYKSQSFYGPTHVTLHSLTFLFSSNKEMNIVPSFLIVEQLAQFLVNTTQVLISNCQIEYPCLECNPYSLPESTPCQCLPSISDKRSSFPFCLVMQKILSSAPHPLNSSCVPVKHHGLCRCSRKYS